MPANDSILLPIKLSRKVLITGMPPATDASNIANHVKNFPQEWILPNFEGVTQEAIDYFIPLLQGQPEIIYDERGLPKHVVPYYNR